MRNYFSFFDFLFKPIWYCRFDSNLPWHKPPPYLKLLYMKFWQNSVILTTFDFSLSQRLCEDKFPWCLDYMTLFLQLIYDTVRSGGSNAAGFENCLDYFPSEMFSGRYYSCRTVLYSYFLYLFFNVMHKPIFFVGKENLSTP